MGEPGGGREWRLGELRLQGWSRVQRGREGFPRHSGSRHAEVAVGQQESRFG